MRCIIAILIFGSTIQGLDSQEIGNEGTQSVFQKNTVYLEVLGNAPLYSINFDRILSKQNKRATAGRVGLMVYPASDYFLLSFPLEMNILFGQGKGYFELGSGFTPFYHRWLSRSFTNANGNIVDFSSRDAWFGGVSLRVGYRRQKPEGGFFYRLGFTPMLFFSVDENVEVEENGILPWGGLSIGYTFKRKN